MTHTQEREYYKMKCKHYSDDVCLKQSGWSGVFHYLIGCNCKCKRMKNYDKKHKI